MEAATNSRRPTNSRDLRCDFIGAGDLEISSADEIDDRENLKDNILPVGCNNRYKISSSVLCSLYSFMRCFTALSMTNSRKSRDAVILTERSDEGSLFHNYCKYFADPHLFATEPEYRYRRDIPCGCPKENNAVGAVPVCPPKRVQSTDTVGASLVGAQKTNASKWQAQDLPLQMQSLDPSL